MRLDRVAPAIRQWEDVSAGAGTGGPSGGRAQVGGEGMVV